MHYEKSLRELRLARKLSISETARMLGTPKSTLSLLESGKRKLSLATAIKIGKAYGIDWHT